MFLQKMMDLPKNMLLSGNGDQPWRISDLQALLSLYRIARSLEVTR